MRLLLYIFKNNIIYLKLSDRKGRGAAAWNGAGVVCDGIGW